MLQSPETSLTRILRFHLLPLRIFFGFHYLPQFQCFLQMQLTLGANHSPLSYWAGRLWAQGTWFLNTWKPRWHTSSLGPTLFPRNFLECVSGNPITSLHESRVKEAISEFLLSVFLIKKISENDHREPHKDIYWVCTAAIVTFDVD